MALVGTTTVGPLSRSPPGCPDRPSPPGPISLGPTTIAAAIAAAMAPAASSRQAQDGRRERRSSRRERERRVLSSQRRRRSSSSFCASCARRRCGCGRPGLAVADLLLHRRASTLALAGAAVRADLATTDLHVDARAISAVPEHRLGLRTVELQGARRLEQPLGPESVPAGQKQRVRLPELPVCRAGGPSARCQNRRGSVPLAARSRCRR